MEDCQESKVVKQLPLYQSHKKVRAAKISDIAQDPAENEAQYAGGDWYIATTDGQLITVGHNDYILRHMPEPGGYYVLYEDGYQSYSPAKAFEEGYTRVGDGMTFGQALEALKAGKRVARKGWNGKGMWIEQQKPDAHSKMTLPYLYLNYPEGSAAYPEGARVPWLSSQTDMLADDWMIV